MSISEIRKSIEETVRPWGLLRNVDVLWDIRLDAKTKVYADLALIRRLVVKLAENAICVSPVGGVVLVQLQPQSCSSPVRWAIIDRGCGIKRRVMQQMCNNRISTGGADAVAESGSGGEGLGLFISRQLAALHFSDLQVCSRIGQGTEVSFTTVLGGPRGVVDAWSSWRNGNHSSLQKPRPRGGGLQRVDRGNHQTNEKVFEKQIELPIISVTLAQNATRPKGDKRIVAGVVALGAAVHRATAGRFDHVLERHQSMFDFVIASNRGSGSGLLIFVPKPSVHASNPSVMR